MIISAIDRKTKKAVEVVYAGTFFSASSQTLLKSSFPDLTNPFDAEMMLHLLNNMCHRPDVFKYFRQHIPSPFFPARIMDKHLPVLSLLNYLAAPSNVYYLPWSKEWIEYDKHQDGIGIKYCTTDFYFPAETRFVNEFIDAFGIGSWSDLDKAQPLSDFNFENAGNNVSVILNPLESYFIGIEAYSRLCFDLQNICRAVERHFVGSLTLWDDCVQREPILVTYLRDAEITRQR